MALYVSSACFCGFSQKRVERIKAVASEGFATAKTEEEKVKLGGSDLKVTKLGIGAWSWGDTSYWNNFEWDGELQKPHSVKGTEIENFEMCAQFFFLGSWEYSNSHSVSDKVTFPFEIWAQFSWTIG